MQNMIGHLQSFYKDITIPLPSYPMEIGAGTLAPYTVFHVLGEKQYNISYIQASKRPLDGRFGKSDTRLQNHHQYQVIINESLYDKDSLIDLFCLSLPFFEEQEIEFKEDSWENKSISASGMGYEVLYKGVEIAQITRFECMLGQFTKEYTEITYGLERIALLKNETSLQNLYYSKDTSYFDIFYDLEKEFSEYYFDKECDNVKIKKEYISQLDYFIKEADKEIIIKNRLMVGYNFILYASHWLNIAESKGLFDYYDYLYYLRKIITLSKVCGEKYVLTRQ